MPTSGSLEQGFIRVCEAAALAAAQTMGYGDSKRSDQAAVEAMRHELGRLPMRGRIVIGEGERDKAPMLFIGEKVGDRSDGAPKIDIAVDPLEGTNLCATGTPNAIAVMAAEFKSEFRMGVSPTMVFFNDTVFEVTNWAYSHAALRRSSGVLLSKVHEPVSW